MQSLISSLAHATTPQTVSQCPDGAVPQLMAGLAAARGHAVYIARDDAAASMVAEAAHFFAREIEIIYFPAWDCLPYDRAAPAPRVVADRLSALRTLALPASKPRLLVTTVNAMLQRVLPRAQLERMTRVVRKGGTTDRAELLASLASLGYARVDTVIDPGEFAVRGSILDIFPAGETSAVRIDFFGDVVDSLRTFDPADQRTIAAIETFSLMPVSETPLDAAAIKLFRQNYVEAFGGGATGDALYQSISEGRRFAGQDHWLPFFTTGLVTLPAEYIPPSAAYVLDAQGSATAENRFEAVLDYYQARVAARSANTNTSYQPVAPDLLYVGADEWKGWKTRLPIHSLSPFAIPGGLEAGIHSARDFAIERQGSENLFDAVVRHLANQQALKKRCVILCYSEGSRDRLAGLLAEHGAPAPTTITYFATLQAMPTAQSALAVVPLEHGYDTADYCLLTEQDILGERLVRKRRQSRRADNFIRELSTLTPGDLVVHIEHGIGRYEGLQTIEVSGAPHDCAQLMYADNAKLYVPVENIDVLSRYGTASETAQLDRLGGASWQARKSKLKDRITAIAGELIKVAAARALRVAEPIPMNQSAYEEFSARFPFVETEDQARAIIDVISDLGSGKPMDRLICGDVGFGKTEVALRTALMATLEGQQVAVVCPTTLLARQHFATFTARFKGFPVRVGALSRLVSARDATQVRKDLADGTLDIVVGTHAVLAKAISFKRLGLVIVDEEQHFGVTHKERLKQMREDVHVLTLTATPIPRTLQMALTGLRELSVIATPPVDRLAVRTYIAPWDPIIIREALMREHLRGGQSFFVCPRISDLVDIEKFIRASVPEVRLVVAHGQMAPSEIEDRISSFYERRFDVLLSTTIVESGLDIPNANTLIIHRAEMFGLSQLYQLRGRVGRAKVRAYAYMTTSADTALTETAQKRLNVLQSLDSLGAGFQLASHDLDIRGAGNLLGDEQSGHIKEIGFELYQQMLEDAILAARAGAAGLASKPDDYSPQISVGASVLIPDSYVPDLGLRMALYRRMGDLTGRAEIDAFAAEMIDRFGALPTEARNLLKVIEIKAWCKQANIAKIDAGPRGVVIGFFGEKFANVPALLDYVAKSAGIVRLRPDSKLMVSKAWRGDTERLVGITDIAKTLAKMVSLAKPVQSAVAART